MQDRTTVSLSGPSSCWKCAGLGTLPEFGHVSGGCCFSCGGSGETAEGEFSERRGVYSFTVDGLVWQFNPIHHETTEDGCHRTAQEGERVDSVLFQVFENGAKRRNGVTLLRARVSPNVGRKAMREAREGMRPGTMTDEYLETVGQRCAVTRGRRGINEL